MNPVQLLKVSSKTMGQASYESLNSKFHSKLTLTSDDAKEKE